MISPPSIVIPTYNEKDNIFKILEKLKKVLKNIAYEIIFVDDIIPTKVSNKKLYKTRNCLIHRIGRKGLWSCYRRGLCCER